MKVALILNTPDDILEVTEKEVIYTDGGYRFQKQLNKKVVALVGDFDSLADIPNDENIIKLEREKNFTDGEKAIHLAKEYGYSEIVIYGAMGGKPEHVLGNIALLKIAKDLGLIAQIKEKNREISIISGEYMLDTYKGANISLIPYGGNCSFCSSKGLYYPLDNLTLTVADTRGISNVANDEKVKIKFSLGEAILIVETRVENIGGEYNG